MIMVETVGKESMLTRFTLSQRIEHSLLIVSFTMLCVTGLPQRFFDAAWAQRLISLMGGLDTVRVLHHLFGIMLLFEAVYHIVVVVYELLFATSKPTAMLPRPQDVKDGLRQVAYLAGINVEKPKFGRYDFRQKVEYWSLVWGTVLMGLTGLILLFPIVATRSLSGVIVTACRVIHSYEGLLAFLALVLWHFYNAHFAAESFPIGTSILTGKISAREMREEHPLEYERLMLEGGQAVAGDE
jgi:formate dehydrogenase subunit gamma